MAFDTYAALKLEVVDWLHRADLTAKVPGFIALAEATINRKLNIAPREIDVPLVAVIGSRFIVHPTDMSEPIALWLERDQPRTKLTAALPGSLEVNAAQRGAPAYWAIDGARIALNQAADVAYPLTFRHVQDSRLSDANPVNELLRRAPDLYLAGALAQAAPYMRDDARAPMWEGKFRALLRDVHAEYSRSKSIAPLMTELPLSTMNNRRY